MHRKLTLSEIQRRPLATTWPTGKGCPICEFPLARVEGIEDGPVCYDCGAVFTGQVQ